MGVSHLVAAGAEEEQHVCAVALSPQQLLTACACQVIIFLHVKHPRGLEVNRDPAEIGTGRLWSHRHHPRASVVPICCRRLGYQLDPLRFVFLLGL